MVRVVGIHHLALVTGSLDLTLRFWRDLVGLQVRSRLGSPGYRQYFLAAGGQTLLSFFEWSGAEPVPEKDHGAPQRGPIAFDHVAFELGSDEELFQTARPTRRRRLLGLGGHRPGLRAFDLHLRPQRGAR